MWWVSCAPSPSSTLRSKASLSISPSGAAKPLYVPDTLTMIELLEAFKKHRQHLALVIDEFGEVQGLVTMNDVMEALVGDVATVEDAAAARYRAARGRVLAGRRPSSSSASRKRSGSKELADEDGHSYRTLGGLAMKVLGRVPQVGDRFLSGGLLRGRRHGPEPRGQAARHPSRPRQQVH